MNSRAEKLRCLCMSERVSVLSGDWFSAAQVANFLGGTCQTVLVFVDSGQLAAFRMGRVIRYRGVDVDLFVESCRIKPRAQPPANPPPTPRDNQKQ